MTRSGSPIPARCFRTASAAALLASAAVACAPARAVQAPVEPPREPGVPVLRIVALAPMRAPADLDPHVKGRFTATFDARLREAGVAVLPPADVGPVLDAATESKGGFYDPVTGKLDKAKLAGARDEALRNLVSKFGPVDAILLPELRVVKATLVQDTARWDGTSETTNTGFFNALVAQHSGSVRALSLLVRVIGPGGKELYYRAAGLRVLDKIEARGARVPVPLAELFADEERNAAAVSRTLGPLLAAVPQRAGATAPLPESPAVPAAAAAPPAPPPVVIPQGAPEPSPATSPR